MGPWSRSPPHELRYAATRPALRRLTDRRRLRHQRWRAVAAVAAAVALAATVTTLWQADAARNQWVDTRMVVVTTGDLDTGRVISAADLRTVELPLAAIPPDATGLSPADLVGATVNRPMYAGEVVVDQRLGPAGLSAVAARVPSGYRAVAVPTGSAVPPLSVGDRVDLLTVGDPYASRWSPAPSGGSTTGARTVARRVEVLATSVDTLTVIVADAAVADVVAAAVAGVMVAVLVGG
jgi:Flp pilus assembly protein CpaB